MKKKCLYCKSSREEPKISYDTKEEALATAEYCKKREREKTGIKLRLAVYPCPHGNGFHLTKEQYYDWKKN